MSRLIIWTVVVLLCLGQARAQKVHEQSNDAPVPLGADDLIPLYLTGAPHWRKMRAADITTTLGLAPVPDYCSGCAWAQGTMPAPGGGTSSSSGVLFGLSNNISPPWPALVTLVRTGAVRVRWQFSLVNNTANCGGDAWIVYGAGSQGPAFGASPGSGTEIGVRARFQNSTASRRNFIELEAELTGLTVGTTYWFDVGVANPAYSGCGAASVTMISPHFFAMEY